MGAEKSQEINENVGVYRTSNFEEILKKKSPAVKEHCFNAYVVKEAKSDTTHCECLCLAGGCRPVLHLLTDGATVLRKGPA